MPPPSAAPAVKPRPESRIVDLMGADDPIIPTLQPKIGESASIVAAASVNREAGLASDGVLPLLNGPPTWLNAVEDKKVGSLVRAFHLSM